MPQAQLFDYFLVALMLPLPVIVWAVAIFAIMELIQGWKSLW